MARRTPFLPAAVLGNGQLLVTLSARGEVERMFWPHVDGPEHVRELRLAVSLGGEPGRPLDEAPFVWEQQYERGATVLRTVAGDGELRVELVDVVDVDEPVLARRVRGESAGASLVVSVTPSLGGGEALNAGYVDPATGAFVAYGRVGALAVLSDPPAETSVLRLATGERATVEHRFPIAGELTVPLAPEATVYIALGADAADALAHASAARDAGFAALLERRLGHDGRLVLAAAPPVAEEDLYRRSLLVLDALTDRATGGVIAAPECDPGFVHSGGYGFVWPRDFAYVLLALLAARRIEQASAGLRWLGRAQAPGGLWLQRYWTEGTQAPAWSPHQLDETGVALFAYEAAWRELGDEALDLELWPSARAGAGFLAGFVDHESGLLLPSVDLWEQDDAQHTYTSAAAAGGLRAAAAMAERHEPALADGWRGAAESIATGIEERLWSDADGRYVRACLVGREDLLGDPVPRQFTERPPFPARAVLSVDPLDRRLDSSLLGLAWPFAVVEPDSPRMAATAAAIERELAAPGGGVLRHEGDTYRGGNAWVLSTLWLGLYRRLVGDDDGLDAALTWTRSRATPLDLLPEQAGPDGSPAWVLPLAWSHALFILAVRPELRLIADHASDMAARATSRL
jgi:GH15 family glucan-1,4-alpha-glucosidase